MGIFLHLLEPEERLRLPKPRRKVLENLLKPLSAIDSGAQAETHSYEARIIGFRRSQVRHKFERSATLAEDVAQEGLT